MTETIIDCGWELEIVAGQYSGALIISIFSVHTDTVIGRYKSLEKMHVMERRNKSSSMRVLREIRMGVLNAIYQ